MAWINNKHETLSSTSDTMDTTSMTASDFGVFLNHGIPHTSQSTDEDIQDETWTSNGSNQIQAGTPQYVETVDATAYPETSTIYYDIGTANITDTWTLKAKMVISNFSAGGHSHGWWWHLGLSSNTSHGNSSHDGIDIVIHNSNTYQRFMSTASNGAAVSWGSGSIADSNGDTDYLDDGTYYLTLERTSEANYTCTIRTGSHSGTVLGSVSGTNATGVADLRYIKSSTHKSTSASGGGGKYRLYDIDLTTSVTTYTDEKASITNVTSNTRYEETDTRKIYSFNSNAPWTSTNWTERGDTPSGAFRGVFGGGSLSSSQVNTMDYVTISTLGNASDFGDLTVTRSLLAGVFDATRGVFCGGRSGSTYHDTLDYVTIGTTGNATDFGNNNTDNAYMAGCSSDVRGCYGGGWR